MPKNKKRKPVKIRNAFALHAKSRKSAGAMKDRRAPRGGTKNKQQQYMDEENE